MSLARLLEQATPGPWEFRVWGRVGDEWPDSRVSIGTTLGHGEAVAVNPRYGERRRDLVNARLIALAPEMARLLIDMAEWMQDLAGDEHLMATPRALLARFAELDGQAKEGT